MMNDDQYLLASAYADGEVTPAERALAEADPAVMTEVARLQALREALNDVDAPADAARATMIATAMAEFEVAPDVAPVVAPIVTREPARRVTPTIVSSRRPARWFNWERAAGLAAAAVAVVAIGAVVANGTRGGDDDDSADMAATEFSTEAAEVTAADGGDDSADATAVLDAPEDRDVARAPASADTLAAASTEAPAVLAAPSEQAIGAADSELALPVIESPEQLADVGAELRASYAGRPEQGDDTMGTTPTSNECTFIAAVESPLAIPEAEQQRDELLELAERVELLDTREYRVGPDDVGPAVIAVDLDTGQAFAIEPVDCALLAIGPRP